MINLFTLLISHLSFKIDTIESTTIQQNKINLLTDSIFKIVIGCNIIATVAVIIMSIYFSILAQIYIQFFVVNLVNTFTKFHYQKFST